MFGVPLSQQCEAEYISLCSHISVADSHLREILVLQLVAVDTEDRTAEKINSFILVYT